MLNWWLPENVTSYGQDIDWLFHLIYAITGVTFILVTVALLAFVVIYRDRPGRRARYTHGNTTLEIVWTVVPALILVVLTFLSVPAWSKIKMTMPATDVVIQVTAKQFNWQVTYPGPDGKFAFRLLDPSVLSRSVFDRIHASILMSGTLFPAEMYADLLGIAARRQVLRTYASPFPRENRLLLVSPNVTTLFVKRGKEMHDAIAREIGGIAAAVPGNVAAFFPSYELLGEAHRRLRAARVPKQVLVERPDWSKTQRDGALEALRLARTEGGALLLGVQGGSLSEGVDYHDNLLAAVIVVGLPLSPPSVEGEALRDYYARKFGFAKGHDYAVVYPAVNRLLQAAGRAIRSERDRAAIVLLEGRILEPRYARCLPPDFAPARSEGAASEASRFLQPPG